MSLQESVEMTKATENSFLDVLINLSLAVDGDREESSLILHDKLKSEPSLAKSVFTPIFRTLLLRNAALEPLFEDNSIYVRAVTYLDYDGLHKVAVGVALLQDYRSHDDKLEGLVLTEIFDYINRENLGSVVNDITVNDIQTRDFL